MQRVAEAELDAERQRRAAALDVIGDSIDDRFAMLERADRIDQRQ